MTGVNKRERGGRVSVSSETHKRYKLMVVYLSVLCSGPLSVFIWKGHGLIHCTVVNKCFIRVLKSKRSHHISYLSDMFYLCVSVCGSMAEPVNSITSVLFIDFFASLWKAVNVSGDADQLSALFHSLSSPTVLFLSFFSSVCWDPRRGHWGTGLWRDESSKLKWETSGGHTHTVRLLILVS